MSNLFSFFRTEIQNALKEFIKEGVFPSSLSFERITVEPPRDSEHGDMATNVAMFLAKQVSLTPATLAEILLKKLKRLPHVEEATFANPGFINFRLTTDFWITQLRTILMEGLSYGDTSLGQGKSVNVEYPSTNPTGPLHVGHCRIAVVGDSVASLLQKIGYSVTRESYINDAGGQALQLARSTYSRYLEALGEESDPPPYKGDYLKPVGQALAEQEGRKWVHEPEERWLEFFRSYTISEMMKIIREDLAALGIQIDIYTSERQIVQDGKVNRAIEHLQELGLLYRGILEPPKGKVSEDWEPREQLIFKSKSFGDDTDRALMKSDGSWTYITPDIAYHFDKFQRGSSILVDILGADHIGYVKRLTAAVNAITVGKAELIIKICQIVKFLDQGVILKMSKRAGVFVTVREAIEKVGKDAIRFMMVLRKNDIPMDFDFNQVIKQSRENPLFYIQYAHARCYSILRHMKEIFPDLDITGRALAQIQLDDLKNSYDLPLIKVLASWPRQVEVAAEMYEPHRIAYYLTEVATHFHALWNQGKEESHLRFIFPHDSKKTQQRFALVWATALVIASGFQVLGITPLEEMH